MENSTSKPPKAIIGCDIGGVVRNLKTGEALPGSLEGIKRLIQEDYKVIFISKCGEKMQEKLTEWLKEYSLHDVETIFVLEDDKKAAVIKSKNVKVMIDDKIKILKDLSVHVKKLWFCDETEKIEGAKKYQPEDFKKVKSVKNWDDVLSLILG